MPEDSQPDPDSQNAPTQGVKHAAGPSASPPGITANSLRITAGKQEILVQGQGPLVLQPGQVTIIIGPNGAGKSSLLKALAGVLPAQPRASQLALVAGDIRWNSTPLDALTSRQRAQTCVYLSQVPALSAVMPVEAVVKLGRIALPEAAPSTTSQAAQWALDLTDARALASRMFHELSAGQQQRIMLARGLCQLWTPQTPATPNWGTGKLLLLDEPASMLDPEQTSTVLRITRHLARAGVCCCCVMHDLISAQHIADQIIMVRKRQAATTATPQVTSGNPSTTLTREALESLYHAPFTQMQHPTGRTVLMLDASRTLD